LLTSSTCLRTTDIGTFSRNNHSVTSKSSRVREPSLINLKMPNYLPVKMNMVIQHEAIIEAFNALGGERTIREVEEWVRRRYSHRWKDFGTAMADMVPITLGGNTSSQCSKHLRVLRRVSRGKYTLIETYEKLEGEPFQRAPQMIRPKRQIRHHPPSSSQARPGKETLTYFTLDREFWVPGNPATFATRGEVPWRDALRISLPERSRGSNERGLTMDFHLANLAPQGQPLDLDNLCEPLFSILINGKGWFGGRRTNMYWFKASKSQATPTGCTIRILSSPPTEPYQDSIFDGYFPGPLPRSAKDPDMPTWIYEVFDREKSNSDVSYSVHLKFDDAKINIGDISTGIVKSTIDCLYPIIGGVPGSPEDWRISILRVEKGCYIIGKGVHISIRTILD